MPYDPNDWHSWLAQNPPPDLQKLVAEHGTYAQITAEAWAAWDKACADWQDRRKERLGGPSIATREALAEMTARPSRRKKR